MNPTGAEVRVDAPSPSGLTRTSVVAVVVTVGGSALRLLVSILLARLFTATEYGRFVVGRTWGEVLARLPDHGYQTLAVKELPAATVAGDRGRFRGYLRAATTDTLLAGAVLTALAVAVYAAFASPVSTEIVVGLLLATPLAASWVMRALLQGDHRFLIGSAMVELLQPLLFVATVGVLHVVDHLTVVAALVAWIVTFTATALVEHRILHHGLPAALRAAPATMHRDEWRRTGRPLFLSQLASAVLDNADLLIVGAMVDRADLAAYAVASRIAILGRIVNSGAQSVAAAPIAAAAAAHDRPELQRIVDRALRVAALPTLAIATVTALAATPIVDVFGHEYGHAATLLRIFLIGNVIDAITGPSRHVVGLGGHERTYAVVMAVAAAALVALVPLGAGLGDTTGAAVVTTSVMVGWNAALFVVARRRMGVVCAPRWLIPRGAVAA